MTPAHMLQLRLILGRAGFPACAAALLLLLAGAGWLWLLPQLRALAEARKAPPPPMVSLAAPAPPPLPAARALELFYASLGERRGLERQVRTLFVLAGRHGLEWRQGDYLQYYDARARLTTYRIDLPLSGSDAAIWEFCAAAMVALPYASLDELSFKREAIGAPAVEAHVRMTLYLTDSQDSP